MARDYRSIKAWQHAYDTAVAVYRVTESFPRSERFGITSQLRRAAASIPANIAEGSSRTSKQDFLRFLEIALGSLRESECFLMLSRDLGFLEEASYEKIIIQVDETGRTLAGFISFIRNE